MTALITLATLAVVAAGIVTTQALFTSTSDNPQTATADRAARWLYLYSQSTDPDGLTGYATRNGSSPVVPAATGSNDTLTVNLGGYQDVGNTNIARVFTLKAPASFPESVTQITATISLTADSATGSQPLTNAKLTTTANGSAANSKNLTAGSKFQVRVTVRTNNLSPPNTLYTPHVKITITFTGFTSTFLQYDVPVKVYDGSGPGPG